MKIKPVLAALAAALLTLAPADRSPAQQSTSMITPNFKDADITQVIEAVGVATGKNIIIDPRVRAQVTMLSQTPMSPAAFYEAFLALLQVHGFMAVPQGNLLKVVPDANMRTMAGNDLPDRISSTSDEIVTQIVQLRHVSSAQLVPILRPLMPQYAHLANYSGGNLLIISDRANNLNRILRIVQRMDALSQSDVEVVSLQNASAAEIVRIVTALTSAQAQAEGGGPTVRLVADDRSNSVLISGDRNQRLRTLALITHLDTPLESGGDTQVRYLRYADAEKIGAKLKEQLASQAAGAGAAAAGATGGPDRSTLIWAEPETNALVMTAPPKTMRALMSIVDKLDIRRAQVLVEAIIVEVSFDKSAELGVNWVIDGANDDTAVGGFVSPVGGTSIVDLAAAIDNPSGVTNANILNGTTIGIGRLKNTGINFGAVIRALRGDANTNVIATPSLTTMDNQEAEIKVAQEVPFVTGQFTNTGGNTGGAVNPFQTIQRQEVGTILKITPQVNEGDSVMLKIEQESSSIAAASSGAVDLVTNKRTINTTVLIEDGGTIVLGGLISDTQTNGEQRVPFLGRIPIIGEAFRTRSAKKNKTNLMVFIRPTILRDGMDAALETNQKYNYMRDEQRRNARGEVLPLLPGTKRSELPPLPEPKSVPPASAPQSTAPPAQSAPQQAPPAQPPAGGSP